ADALHSIGLTQLVATPLYFGCREWYYAWIAVAKQQFGLTITSITHWWAPVKVRVSGDRSVRGQLRQREDGTLQCDFPKRIVLIANHQLYTDWTYLWWAAYSSSRHGTLCIVLKDSIKYIPVLGTGMMLYGFIFLTRDWKKDKAKFQHRLRQLNGVSCRWMSGTQALRPVWLLIFPEGTNLCAGARSSSTRWANRNNITDLRHTLLPRSTGLRFCLSELRSTIDYMYDCTVAYEGVPQGHYGEDVFTLRSTYLSGQPPRCVHMHWRRFAVEDIPTGDSKAFSDWLLARWREKDDLLDYYGRNGRFPSDEEDVMLDTNGNKAAAVATMAVGNGYIDTTVRLRSTLELLQLVGPLLSLSIACFLVFMCTSRDAVQIAHGDSPPWSDARL
ncbi:acyltransferase-domain-containing protein, partial [Boeremia exigua]|uniref:acyltransferase-domain-containing protein n=1 Tax=Boeremia exigua TaxID=749465 RepID=UPI001E8D7801